MAFLFGIVCVSNAQDGSEKEIRVGVFPHKPFVYVGETGEAEGFFVDLLEDIAEKEDWKLIWVDGSWKEGLSRLESGTLDVVTSAAFTEERALKFDYTSNSVYSLWTEVYLPQNSPIHSFKELANKRVGLMQADVNARHFIDRMKSLDIEFLPLWFGSFDAIFESLQEGKLDAGISNNTFGYLNAETYNVRMSGLSISPFDIHYIVKKGRNSDVLTRIDHWLEAYKHDSDSSYYELAQKWTHSRIEVYEDTPAWVWKTLIGFLALGLLLCLNIIWLRYAIQRAIRAEKDAKQQLREELDTVKEISAHLEAAVSAALVGIWDFDVEHEKVTFSDQIASMLAMKVEDLGNDFEVLRELTHKDDLRELNSELEISLKDASRVVNRDVRLRRSDGSWIWINVRWKTVESENEKPIRIIGTHLDISSRKEMELELRDREARYRLLHSNLPVPYLCLDRNGRIIDLNPQWVCTTGYDRASSIGANFKTFLEASSQPRWSDAFRTLKATGVLGGYELSLSKKGKGSIIGLYEGICSYDDHENPDRIYLTFSDITQQRLLEQASRENLQRLKSAVEVARMSIIEWNFKTDAFHHDGRLPGLLGFKEREPSIMGNSLHSEISSLICSEDRERFLEIIETARRKKKRWVEETLRFSGPKNRSIWMRIVAKRIQSEWFAKPTVMIVLVDVHEKTNAEIAHREASENLQKADKLATLGTLASGIAHEINNPNQMILSNTEFLESCVMALGEILSELPEEVSENALMGIPLKQIPTRMTKSFGNIRGGSQRIKAIVSELKDYVRQKDYELKPVDINKVIYSAHTLTSHLGKNKTDRFDWIAETDLFVWGNSQKLEQVFVNILVNAYESLTDKSQQVTIRSFKEDQHVVVTIVDEGVGIPEELIQRVTDPFFTTKQQSGGTGMGLSVVSNILQEHNARIVFGKNTPRGTTVTITFAYHAKNSTA